MAVSDMKGRFEGGVVKSRPGEPVWELARLYPYQGEWTEEAYLVLETNKFVEFSDGIIEVLPMPTITHQLIVLYLYRLLWAFVQKHDLGEVLSAPVPVRFRPGKFREPDVFFVAKAHKAKLRGRYPTGADLIIEVVSGSNQDRQRDFVEKRADYALAGVAEYWIVDPKFKQITVLTLAGEEYNEQGVYEVGELCSSHLLTGFSVDVQAVFASAER